MTVRWRKSSFSGGTQNACVELDHGRDRVAVRDSKNPAAGALTVRPAQWRAFLTALKRGGPGA